MKEIRESKEFKKMYTTLYDVAFAVEALSNALVEFDSKFCGVKYEEYRIKEEDD